jgi:hypothetical protein
MMMKCYRFNAVVSKTMNKHGDNAYSIFETRHFGQGVKINHFFPGKDYYYQEPQTVENKTIENENKPVSETENKKPSENKMILIDSGNKMMVLQPLEVMTQQAAKEDSPIVKMEASEEMMPGLVSVMVKNAAADSKKPVEAPEKIEIANEIQPNTESQPGKENVVADSDVASSFYRQSRIYYVGF